MTPANQHRTGPMGVAVVGCGTISDQYLTNLTAFPDLRVLICADLAPERARTQAEAYGVPAWGGVAEALAHPDVELVVNLTVPAAHAEVGRAAIEAGKHVWNEKPLTADTAGARELLKEAEAAGLRVGGAPDTFLGAGLQSALRLISSGTIGAPLTALSLMQIPGPESWHPAPEFLYRAGGGPLFDMGPYYLTALVAAFGPVRRVSAVGSRSRDRRTIGSGPRAGTEFDVTVPTHVSALLEFAEGGSATTVFSFESPQLRLGFVEVTGTDATLVLPDPNHFDGPSRIEDGGPGRQVAATGTTAGRGTGVLDMARAIRSGEPHRATGELALHVLAVMEAVEAAVDTGSPVEVAIGAPSPQALPEDWDPYETTLRT
ncbi:Gfo/Idh/MocA family oxidoreductase [Kitasatospora paranensis]|uniref:Gfo/Idh/MocA family protein n=1 Tax=Kitasatospora paranensis TaxID=258053 RepID=A0ABW2G5G8_9ACTN